eukprot:CAMPEP_0174253706 /NCGR_PEP_ID=MMETSP0439-20130205/3068_1 /TAXON_ID=0 /ORGANISM="Stereomyxa ramosa, Strain Chinc5" /LENGTH=166 /DNA_ID=CAMNT_0015334881 /DNA_START=105 /DNA_END=605 /DNA_ORIENTATION=-
MSAKKLACFAAGCFWSVELAFQRVPGVLTTAVGYTGGNKDNPTYQQVCSGATGHAEAVQLEYNPEEVSYEELLGVFWKKHNPTQVDRQGNDMGTQYRSAIFYYDDEQKEEAEMSRDKEQEKYKQKIATQIVPASKFWPAETYHQQYLEKGGQCSAKGCTDTIRCYG